MKNKLEDCGARRVGRLGIIGLLALLMPVALVASCGGRAKLRPAPTAQTLPNDKKSAVAEAAGVRMVVETDEWSGNPSNLAQVITPLRVTLENRNGQPLRIRYNEFTLNSATGFQYMALPPYKIEGSVTTATPALAPRFIYRGYYIAPYYTRFYPGLRPWGSPWAYDSLYYGRYYTYWRTPLPTGDMLEMAIPEGVLEPQGSVQGFLYFQPLDDDLKQVTFKANLISAQTGDSFGTLNIPLVVK